MNEETKTGKRAKYPFATWGVGDTYSVVCVYDLIPKMMHRLKCAAINRKKDKSWSFKTTVKQSNLIDYSIVTITRVK